MALIGLDILKFLIGSALTTLTALAGFAMILLKNKLKEITTKRMLLSISEAIYTSVAYVNQKYVNNLKANNKFVDESKELALSQSLKVVKSLLSEDTLNYINETFSNIDEYLITQIEAEVNKKSLQFVEKG